jgi:rRNA-processing protein FCF1
LPHLRPLDKGIEEAKDASVEGAAVRENAPLITRDERLLRFLQEVGIPAERF